MKYITAALLSLVSSIAVCKKSSIAIIPHAQHRANVIAALKRAGLKASPYTRDQLELLEELTLRPLPLFTAEGTPIAEEGPLAQDRRQALAMLSRDYVIRFGMSCPSGPHAVASGKVADVYSHFYSDAAHEHDLTELTLLNHQTQSGIDLLHAFPGLTVTYAPFMSGYRRGNHIDWQGLSSAEDFFELFHLIVHSRAADKQTDYESDRIDQARRSIPREERRMPVVLQDADGKKYDTYSRWEKKLAPASEEAKLLLISQEFADREKADQVIRSFKQYGFDFSPWLDAEQELGDIEMNGYYDSLYGNLAMDSDLAGPGYNSQVFGLGGLHGRGIHGGPWGL